MNDLISRQAAIETVRKAQSIGQAHRMLLQLPSAQLAQDLTNGCTDTISRVAAISICDNAIDLWNGQLGTGALVAVRDAIMALPSAQPVNIAKLQQNCNQVASHCASHCASDCISRQAAIAEIMEDIEDRSLHDDPATPEDYAEGYDEGIRNAAAIVLQMPSAQPGWIPVTERFPRDEEEVIVSIHDDSGDYAYDYTSFGWHIAACEYWIVDNALNWQVTAWMPLPTPWECDGAAYPTIAEKLHEDER